MKRLRRPEPWVFLILFTTYGYFWQARDWNISSRLMLTYALVDRGTLSIDGLDDQTRDIARYQGHFYSDKTPGFSLLATGPYSLAKRVLRLPDHPLNQRGFPLWAADYWVTLGTSGFLTALTGVILVILAKGLGCGPGQSALVGLTYGLATPAYAYATLAYGHQVAAFALIASFGLIWRVHDRPIVAAGLAGFLASYASVVEIQVGPVSAILGLFLVARVMGKHWPPRTIFWFGLGAAIPTAILLTYNKLAFGSPWKMGYFYEVLDQFSTVHSAGNPLGLGRPDWSKLPELIWGERRGLIWFAPIVGLTVPGLVVLGFRRSWSVLTVSTLTMASVLLVNLSYPEWTGGWSTGPRLLVPLLPFALLPVAALLATGGRATTALAIVLAVLGGLVMLQFVAIGARVPQDIGRPWLDGVLPLWRGDKPLPGWVFGNRYAQNLITLWRPELIQKLPAWAGWASLLPLVLFQALTIGLMSRFVGKTTSDKQPE